MLKVHVFYLKAIQYIGVICDQHIDAFEPLKNLQYSIQFMSQPKRVNLSLWICPINLSNPHFLGLQFDTGINSAIGCIYPFGICNNPAQWDIWQFLNLSDIGHIAPKQT